MQTTFIKYVFNKALRIFGILLILASLVILAVAPTDINTALIALMPALIGTYIVSVRILVDATAGRFRVRTQIFFCINQGTWYRRASYPLITLKRIRKTYGISGNSIIVGFMPTSEVSDHSYRVVITGIDQRRQLALFDLPNIQLAEEKVSQLMQALDLKYAPWGSKMKNYNRD